MTAPSVPFSAEAEEAVLGALLIDPGAIETVQAILRPADFFILRHRTIYAAMLALRERKEAADFITVQDQLRGMGQLDNVGGPAAILNLINNTPTSMHAEIYARVVARAATRVRVLEAAERVKASALNEDLSLEEVEGETFRMLEAAFNGYKSTEVHIIRDVVGALLESIDATRGMKSLYSGIPSGLGAWDEITDGFQPESLNLIGARPGMGKTALVCNLALTVAASGLPVLYWSGEMSAAQLVARMEFIRSGVDARRILRGWRPNGLREIEYPHLVNAAEALSGLPIYIDDTKAVTVAQLTRLARHVKRAGGLGLIVVDYLQLMSQPGFKGENRVGELSYISRKLKELADIAPVVAAAQLNRAVEARADKRPLLSDLRESGSLEMDADTVTFLYRDVVYTPATEYPNRAELLVSKNRHGPTDVAFVHADMARQRFSPLQTSSVNL